MGLVITSTPKPKLMHSAAPMRLPLKPASGIVEQFLDVDFPRDEALLPRIIDDGLHRGPAAFGAKRKKVDLAWLGQTGGRLGLQQHSINILHDLRVRFGEFFRRYHHVIDRDDLVLRMPRLRRRLRVRYDALQRRVIGKVGAVNRGVELAFARHLEQVLGAGSPFNARRLVVFGHMAVFERDPVYPTEVDAIIVLKDTAHPHRGGLAVGAHADPFAGKTGGRERARGAAEDGPLLEPAHHRRGYENERLAIGFGLHIRRNRHLADVKLELPHHRLEESIRWLDVGKGERDARRFDLAALERQRVRIVVEGCAQRGHLTVYAHRDLVWLRDGGWVSGRSPRSIPFWNIFRTQGEHLVGGLNGTTPWDYDRGCMEARERRHE